MTTIKESWKVGKDLGNIGDNLTDSELGENVKQFGKDFGKSVVKTVKFGIRAVTEWAANDDNSPEAPAEEPETVEAEEVEAEEVKPEEKAEIIYD